MLTLYRARRSKSEDASSSEDEAIIPAGIPYLTKINGKLMMAREKRDTPASIANDLLGEVFGNNVRIIRRRARSLNREKTPLLIGGVPYAPVHQQQQITYTTPITQQPFSPNILSFAPYQQHLLPPQPPSFTVPNPSENDLEQLKRINTHFNKTSTANQKTVEAVLSNKIMRSKPTIRITKHICANCGRPRSRKYHEENPVNQGDNPVPAFCRKCQRDASSTSSSGPEEESPRAKRKERRTEKNKKKSKKSSKIIESSSESSSTLVLQSSFVRKSSARKETTKQQPQENFTVKEAYISKNVAQEPKGRTRRHHFHDGIAEEFSNYKPTLSSLMGHPSWFKTISTVDFEGFEGPKQSSCRKRDHKHWVSSPVSLQYQYVQAPELSSRPKSKDTHPIKVSSYFLEDDGSSLSNMQLRLSAKQYEEPLPEIHNKHDRQEKQRFASPLTETTAGFDRPLLFRSKGFKENMSHGRRPLRTNTNDSGSHEASYSLRSEEGRQRRRKERIITAEPIQQRKEYLRIFGLSPKGEKNTMAESYEYRPGELSSISEQERRQQEQLDKKMMDFEIQKTEHSAREEAARYYNEDWSRTEFLPKYEPRRSGYRRRWLTESLLTDSDHTYGRGDIEKYNHPRATNPPTPIIPSYRQYRQVEAPYPMSSDPEINSRPFRSRKKYKGERLDSLKDDRQQKSMPISEPAYGRQATRGISESIILSHRQSQEWDNRSEEANDEYDVEEYGSSQVSGLTELERAAQAESRQFTFEDALYQRNEGNCLVITDEVPLHNQSGGWDDAGDRGGTW